jgi:hypothetical protein
MPSTSAGEPDERRVAVQADAAPRRVRLGASASTGEQKDEPAACLPAVSPPLRLS